MFSYEEFWAQEKAEKEQLNELEFNWSVLNERMVKELGDDWFTLLSSPSWVAEENARREALNALYHLRYPNDYIRDWVSSHWARENKLASCIYRRAWLPKRRSSVMRQRFMCCLLILDLNWSNYKFLTIQEIAEMTGLSRQKVRSLVDILLDGGYLKQVKNGFKRVRKAYKPI